MPIADSPTRTMWLALAWITPSAISASAAITLDKGNSLPFLGNIPYEYFLIGLICAPGAWLVATIASSIYLARSICQAGNPAMRDITAVAITAVVISTFHAIVGSILAVTSTWVVRELL